MYWQCIAFLSHLKHSCSSRLLLKCCSKIVVDVVFGLSELKVMVDSFSSLIAPILMGWFKSLFEHKLVSKIPSFVAGPGLMLCTYCHIWRNHYPNHFEDLNTWYLTASRKYFPAYVYGELYIRLQFQPVELTLCSHLQYDPAYLLPAKPTMLLQYPTCHANVCFLLYIDRATW